MLHEKYLQAARALVLACEELDSHRKRIAELDRCQAVMALQLDSLNRRRWLPFVLQLVSAICLGIGVNLLTAKSGVGYGWISVILSIVLEVVAYLVVKMEVNR